MCSGLELNAQSRFIRSWEGDFNVLRLPVLMESMPSGGWMAITMPKGDQKEVRVTKYRPCGDILWEKSFVDPFIERPVSSVFDGQSSDVIILFKTTNQDEMDGFGLLKMDTLGTVLSSMNYFGEEKIVPTSVDVDEGSITVGGTIGSPSAQQFIAFVDSDGNVAWSKKQDGAFFEQSLLSISGGGILSCSGNRISKWTENGSVEWTAYVSADLGAVELGVTDPVETNDGFIMVALFNEDFIELVKINKEGLLLWKSPEVSVISEGALAELLRFKMSRLVVTDEDEIVCAGTTSTSALNTSVVIHKFDSSGTPVFRNIFILSENHFAYDYDLLKNGGIFILGANLFRQPVLFKTSQALEIGCSDDIDFDPEATESRSFNIILQPPVPVSDFVLGAEMMELNFENVLPHQEEDICFFYDNPPTDITIDTFICLGAEIEIVASHPYAQTRWEDGAVSNVLEVEQPGAYYADLLYCGIEQRVNFNVPDGKCPCIVEVPSVFTPNEDGVNDTFAPIYQCVITDFQFSVYNRWGKKVYHSNTPLESWDGKINREKAASDVYMWHLVYEGFHEGQSFKHSNTGNVTLLR